MSLWYSKTIDEVKQELQTDLQKGLSSKEVEERLEKFGLNEFEEQQKASIWKKLWEQINSLLIWILIAASVISAFVGEGTDAIIILLVVALNAIIGVIQESKAEKALDELKKMSSPKAIVKRDGEVKEIPSEQIVPGDIVLIDAGRSIPADLRLFESANFQVEESALTGESVPVTKNADWATDDEVPLGDQVNMAFMNTVSTYGRATGIAVNTGMNTEMGKIAKMLGQQSKEITPLQRKLDQLGKILGIGALIISAMMFVVGFFQGRDVLDMFLIAISLAVAAIPEGMVAIVTIVLAIGMQVMSKKNAIVRKLPAVETLGSVSVICSDKTGTLTQNKMTVTKVFLNGSVKSMDAFSFNGDRKESDPLKNSTEQFFTGMMLCNDATETSGDPTEIALILAGKKSGFTKEKVDERFQRVFELPFDSDRKMMTTVHQTNDGYFSVTKGALESLLPLITSIHIEGSVRPITEEDKQAIQQASEKMSDEALRVLAVARRDVQSEEDFNEELESNLTFLGLVGMIDPPREEVKESIRQTKRAGIRTVMITGDHQMTALAIAKELGIAQDITETMTGKELDETSDEQLQNRVKTVRVFARVSPEHKVRIVKALKANGHIASMTGDGVNDAPSLKQADVGVAMGITGTDVAKGASDIILTDDNFATIVSAVQKGRNIYQNIKKAILFLLSCNLGEITALFIAILLGLPAPLTAVQILWVNLITDTLPAIALGMDPDDPDVMRMKPRNKRESILHGNYAYTILNGMLIGLLTLFSFLFGLAFYTDANSIFSIDYGHISDDALIHAQTMAFITLSFSQLMHSLNLRSQRKSIFQVGLFSNMYLLGAIFIGLVIQSLLVYVPFLNTAFDIHYLTAGDLFFLLLVSITPVIVNEIVKGMKRLFNKEKGIA
ncbi:cation-translocating P-type ATPase [Fervidibacillus albus]|uniref:P-type Ca(2+) transporter n=1 Tax=Fervidibacillus albus TaxID=2980026 RepID=A0A9E8RU84_9BACI|nr:cation-translocating P-type ATPase [Fervidibacillus albus]WAA09030.1 cation-translocating P-type ATPase [Fervidibacillus albus]